MVQMGVWWCRLDSIQRGWLSAKEIFFSEDKGPTIQTLNKSQTINESPGSINVSGPVTGSLVTVGDNNQQSYEVHHHHHHSNVGQNQELVETKPNPNQIYDDIYKLPPYRNRETRLNYLNLTVRWQVTLEYIRPMGTGHLVRCKYINGTMRVNFIVESVSLELKIADQGTPLLVSGKIKEVNPLYIELSEPTILRVKQL
jgi:hypothetical protein